MNTDKFLLIISKNYWGSSISENTALNFSSIFSNLLNIPNQNILHLIGDNVNVNSVKETFYKFITNVLNTSTTQNCNIYIYMNGHGGQIHDTSGDELCDNNNLQDVDPLDETYHLPDGQISDDDITNIINKAVATSNRNSRPLIFLISDHCSSGSMIDKYTYSNKLLYDWITIGSSRDYQDSYISGDGHIMTINFLDIMKTFTPEQINSISILDFYNILDMEIKSTFIGELQFIKLRVSNKDLYDFNIFQ